MDGTAPPARRGRKHEQVLEGAREVFMADGYQAASVDEIARRAGVSKATLYSYFPEKALLFMEVARSECARQADTALASMDDSAPPVQVLGGTARHFLGFLLSEFGQRVFRICVAESDRFPELGREFYRSGPALMRARMVAYLEAAVARGDLAIEDCQLAADQFAELCKADLFPRLVFGIDTQFSEAEIERVISGALETFMARYGPRGG